MPREFSLFLFFLFLYPFPSPSSHHCPCHSHFHLLLHLSTLHLCGYPVDSSPYNFVSLYHPWKVSTLFGTMTSSIATMCHGTNATSTPVIKTKYGKRIVLQTTDAQQPKWLVRDRVMYDGRTQETFNQQLTVPLTSHRRHVFFNQTYRQLVSQRILHGRRSLDSSRRQGAHKESSHAVFSG